eukprot:5106920-Pyramimonas_sp.AAC.1
MGIFSPIGRLRPVGARCDRGIEQILERIAATMAVLRERGAVPILMAGLHGALPHSPLDQVAGVHGAGKIAPTSSRFR